MSTKSSLLRPHTKYESHLLSWSAISFFSSMSHFFFNLSALAHITFPITPIRAKIEKYSSTLKIESSFIVLLTNSWRSFFCLSSPTNFLDTTRHARSFVNEQRIWPISTASRANAALLIFSITLVTSSSRASHSDCTLLTLSRCVFTSFLACRQSSPYGAKPMSREP
ncbi:Os11g0465750 [Oryza sativa Japonica Group]|uniref:Os11g0465750 protein n=1 Tax=Oryza sativa subsp. japonica TaxID=39947 RepID=A0A0P0Y2F3_ORYSJ|nr:hypothetical protein EE612_055449 [Oryza sativa]BAT13972.1 Os11g0465750 [Oryza sativa Japonica Group]